MDAVVLAGGYATRLWPITKHRPKMFLPLDGTTVVDHVFEELEADTRIDTVYVSTNAEFADAFRRHLDARPYEKPVLSVEETTCEDEKFGVIGALAELVDREEITDDLLVIAGDNYISFDVSAFIDHFQTAGVPTLAAYDVGDRERARQYGVVDVTDGRVTAFEEKPAEPASTLVSIACYGFPADAVALLETYLHEGNNPDEPGWFLQWLVDRGPVSAFSFDGAWFDIGTPGSYLDAVAHHLDGGTRIADTATVVDSELGHNVYVMEDATVEEATLANAVVFPEATITAATLEETVVDQHSTIEGVNLESSVVGPHTTLSAD